MRIEDDELDGFGDQNGSKCKSKTENRKPKTEREYEGGVLFKEDELTPNASP